MSDNDDDYMCEEEEDYGLVCLIFLFTNKPIFLLSTTAKEPISSK